jgi:drug/metabolite transporter (DMT)-like permease
MDGAIWGALSALSFGTADFFARFTGRRLGTNLSLALVLVVGLLPTGAYLILSGSSLHLAGDHVWLVLVYGAGTAVATKLLYEALARGPVTVVAPIVAAYPAFVVLFASAMGRNPGALQLAATVVVLAGALVTARFSEPDTETTLSRQALLIAVAASLSYAGLVVAGQAATPAIGAAQTALWGRIVAILVILPITLLGASRAPANRSIKAIYLLVGLQGVLDGGGHLLLFAGSHGPHPEIAAVAGSCFGAVTALLAWIVLSERVAPLQWVGMVLVFAGVAALSAVA